VWDADDWLFELGYLGAAKDYGLGAYSSEAAYKAAGKKIEADALQYGVVLINTDAVLRRIRQALQAEAKEDVSQRQHEPGVCSLTQDTSFL
jgi:hypothetical protein